MKKKRILLVRDKDYFFYVYQLVAFLTRNGHEVEVLHTLDAEPEPLYRDLITKTQQLAIKCHLVQSHASLIEQKLVSLGSRLRIISKLSVIRPHKIRAARRALAHSKKYDFIIAYDPPSLFLACKLFPNDLNKIINYSLEIDDETSWVFQRSRFVKSFRYFERSVQSKLYALMIQDKFRAQVLLRNCVCAHKIRTIFYPVAMSGGPSLKGPSESSFRQQGLHHEIKIIFFGAIWSQELLGKLKAVSTQLGAGQVLIIHGGRGSVRPPEVNTEKFIISTKPIPFDCVNEYIAAADLGLAIYPERTANNSRYTAFSSEKIARYTQCGIPFVAFHNEDYEFLRAETGCCELVRDYSEIPIAVNTILQNYDRYRRGAILAFDRFYCLENTGVELLKEISGAAQSRESAFILP
jgi:hypothetical protein